MPGNNPGQILEWGVISSAMTLRVHLSLTHTKARPKVHLRVEPARTGVTVIMRCFCQETLQLCSHIRVIYESGTIAD